MDIYKETRRFFSGIGFRYILFFFAVFGAQISMQFLWLYLFGRESLDTSIFKCLAMAVPVDLIGTPLLLVTFLSQFKKERIQREEIASQGWPGVPVVKMTFLKFVKYVCMLVPLLFIGSLTSLMINGIISMMTGIKIDNDLVLEAFKRLNPVGRIIVTCVCAPIFEELVFRKLLVDRIVKYGEKLAIITSGVMFGLFHGNFEQFFYACFLGMFFAYIYIRTGKIIYTMILHFCVNFSSAAIIQTIITKIDLNLMQKVADGKMNMLTRAEQIAFGEMAPWIILYMAYVVFLIGLFVAGLVLWIMTLARRPIIFFNREMEIPKGQKFKLAYANPGMIIYILLCIGLCIYTIISQMLGN